MRIVRILNGPALALVLAMGLSVPATAQTILAPSLSCLGDGNADTQVTVDEIIGSVNNALQGCGFVPVTISFAAAVGDEPFACGNTYEGVGTGGVSYTPADLRFYVHNVRLIDEAGREVPIVLDQDGIWQDDDLVLLDFEDKSPPCNNGTTQTNTTIRGMVPAGNYDGIRFALGVPFRMNHQDVATAESPLVLTSMFWNWQGGYKFIRIDDQEDLFRVHVGSTGCAPGPTEVDACQRPNRGEAFLLNFDPATDTIIADLAALLADSDLEVNQAETPPGCMAGPSDLDCTNVLANLGVNFANGLPDPSRQIFFRVAP